MTRRAPARILFSAGASSAGKSTISSLFTLWARQEGLQPAAFKAGPDFIDAQYLGAAAGREAWNLDSWMTRGRVGLLRSFERGSRNAGMAVIEGVMGLLDGKKGAPLGRHSSAELAYELKCPVVLILGARKAGVTLGALALGLRKAAPKVDIRGVILNQVSGERHAQLIVPAIKKLSGLPVLGWLPEIPELKLAERHLGLTALSEVGPWQARLEAALVKARASINFMSLARIAQEASPISLLVPKPAQRAVALRIAYAWDAAFHFYYPENLRLLESLGVKLLPFSPLKDKALPQGSVGLYLGGGFPESFASNLARNYPMKKAIKKAITAGMPCRAECGGLIYLSKRLRLLSGDRHSMVGVLNGETHMTTGLRHFGYTEVTRGKDQPRLRGHEFHHSEFIPAASLATRWTLRQSGKAARREGYVVHGGLATYLHAHWGACPQDACDFVTQCHVWQSRRGEK